MNRRTYLLTAAGVFLLLLVLWLAWPDSGTSADDQVGSQPTAGGRHHRDAGEGFSGEGSEHFRPDRGTRSTGEPMETRSQASRQRLSSADHEVLKRIDHLIINDSLEDQEVTRQLGNIAADSNLSTEVRAEALGHGLLLDTTEFAGLAAQPELPAELALELLGEVVNHNESPAMQIQVYRDFMDHPSPEVRELADEMLRFMVEDDFDEADRDTLLRMAREKLVALENEPSVDRE